MLITEQNYLYSSNGDGYYSHQHHIFFWDIINYYTNIIYIDHFIVYKLDPSTPILVYVCVFIQYGSLSTTSTIELGCYVIILSAILTDL